MLSKRPRPMIAKLSELLVPGNRVGVSNVSPSPRSPLDLKMQSPRGLKNIDLGGVGLGIVAALDKAGDIRREILPKFAICSSNLSRSEPIPVSSAKNNCDRLIRAFDEFDEDSLENYSYVTCRNGHNKSITKVYYDGGDQGSRIEDQIKDFGRHKKMGIFESSPVSSSENFSELPTSDFLSSCYLCRAKLHGKDIYMYRGEKAFCSTECRSNQIMMDERKELCRSEASRSMDVSNSSYTRDEIFSTGIIIAI